MNHQRAILALFVIAALVTGTAGYSSLQADRSVDVAVAGDADAFLAVDGQSPDIQNGSSKAAFAVTNQLGQPVEITAETESAADAVELDYGGPTDVSDGHTATINATCTGESGGTLAIEIEAESDNGETMVRTFRKTEVTCT